MKSYYDLSKRQKFYREHLLKKLGFVDGDFLDQYRKYLIILSPKFRFLGAKKEIKTSEKEAIVADERFHIDDTEDGQVFIPTVFHSLDLVLYEYNAKKDQTFIQTSNDSKYVSATDISNFTFCPVSYSISKSFKIEKLEHAVNGTNEHKKQRLLNFTSRRHKDYINRLNDLQTNCLSSNYFEYDETENKTVKNFFRDLHESECVYKGHDEGDREHFFINEDVSFRGQPDYVFYNFVTDKFYIVEEKFQYMPIDPTGETYISEKDAERMTRKRNTRFYENHINQVRSYIYGVNDYEIEYGYLVYWKYRFDENGSMEIVGVRILRVDKTEENKNLFKNIHDDLLAVLKNKGGTFDPNSRVPAKCAGCVVNIMCGHKTGRFTNYTIPYDRIFQQTINLKLPIQLELKGDYIGELNLEIRDYELRKENLLWTPTETKFLYKLYIDLKGAIPNHFFGSAISISIDEGLYLKLKSKPPFHLKGHVTIVRGHYVIEKQQISISPMQ